MLCFEVLGYVKISSIVLTLSRLWNCPTYQRNHKNKNLTGSKSLNYKSLEDIFVGCTDILGISEIRTEAKMIYIGVGTDPFKQCGKGGWEEDGARRSGREGAAGGPGASYLPWAVVFWVVGSHVAFIELVSCCSQEEPPRPHLWGELAYWMTHFKSKSSSWGLWGVRFGCMRAHLVACVMSLTTWQYGPPYDFFCHWKKWSSCSRSQMCRVCTVILAPLFHSLLSCNIKVDAFF